MIIREVKVALTGEDELFRKRLAMLVNGLSHHRVVVEARNGRDLIAYLHNGMVPDIVLLDIGTTVINGYETTVWLKKNYPDVHVLARMPQDNRSDVIQMYKAGIDGCISKDCAPAELKHVFHTAQRAGTNNRNYPGFRQL